MNSLISGTVSDMSTIERAVVMGSVASGKSTFAERLATTMELPLVHIDQIYQDRPARSYPIMPDRPVIAEAAKDKWVIEGNGFSEHIGPNYRLERADAIFIFDIHPLLSLANHIARSRRVNKGLELPVGGCNGKLALKWYIPYCLFRCPEGIDRMLEASQIIGKEATVFTKTKDAFEWLDKQS